MSAKINYILQRRSLFWSVSDKNLPNISDELLVETILNYGTLEDTKELINLLGIMQTATIFRKTTLNRIRHNYFPETANFFTLYFNRHAPGNPI
jgi:hypothetical protein